MNEHCNKSTIQRISIICYHQPVEPTPAATHVLIVSVDAAALFLSFAVHISPSLYAAAYEQAPVKHITYTDIAYKTKYSIIQNIERFKSSNSTFTTWLINSFATSAYQIMNERTKERLTRTTTGFIWAGW